MPPRHDPAIAAHQKWLDFVRPYGIVVVPSVLVDHNVALPIIDAAEHDVFKSALADHTLPDGRSVPVIGTFPEFVRDVLGWSFDPNRYAWSAGVAPDGAKPPAPDLPVLPKIDLPDGGGELRPSFGVRTNPSHRTAGEVPWQLVTFGFDPAIDLDDRDHKTGHHQASPVSRAERYLRETGIVAAIVTNRRVVRLLVVPPGETSAWADFQVEHMAITAGRDIVAAMRALLSELRFHRVPVGEQLRALVVESRKSQANVTTDLAEQVLHGLYELVRGLDVANERTGRRLLRDLTTTQDGVPHVEDGVYRGLLTFIMRLLFLLFAEERDLLHRAPPRQNAAAEERDLLHRARPGDASADAMREYYSVLALYDRLRQDQATNPDTMDHRYGAWAQLLALFRMVHNGAPEVGLVARAGSLFDPDTYRFLEGRHTSPSSEAPWAAPRVSDGTIFRVLTKLLVIDGARVSYRALDVEHIGAIYETMMGFHVGVAAGPSVAIRAQTRLGAPTTINLAAMLDQKGERREAWLKEASDRTSFPNRIGPSVKVATTAEELHLAILPVVNELATPEIVPAGHLVLFPSEERRRSGSHYTPRALTAPIVKRTLDPQLDRLAAASPTGSPRADDILDLKVCDPAMGSGAFLVETCRYLGDALIAAWAAHGDRPTIPWDEDEATHARRLVAQRCLYGVDRNAMAVELAKVSIWLATLARDHPFTFIDHAFRHGDSLVGLTDRQIGALTWLDGDGSKLRVDEEVKRATAEVLRLRRKIREAKDNVPERDLSRLALQAQAAGARACLFGDLVIQSFFDGDRERARQERLNTLQNAVNDGGSPERLAKVADDLAIRRTAHPPFVPFHWHVVFPEVFDRENAGFDAFVGNPPFLGGSRISTNFGPEYLAWVLTLHEAAHGNGDLVVHFFRRAFNLVRTGGTLGLIATNTIAQGDTRASGLRWICQHGGQIYDATRRYRWPGQAAVVVSVVHIAKGAWAGPRFLDGVEVDAISAFLVRGTMHADPYRLQANAGMAFQGSMVIGMGFTFEHDAADDVSGGAPGTPTSVRRMKEILEANPRSRDVIFPYIGGEEVNSSPTHAYRRWVINFRDRDEETCEHEYPELMAIVRAKVKPDREQNSEANLRKFWWRYKRSTPALHAAMSNLDRVVVVANVTSYPLFARVDRHHVFAHTLVVFASDRDELLAVLHSHAHDDWARTFGSSMKNDLRYTPSDCFVTFPFPADWEGNASLVAAGRAYDAHRAGLMVANDQGLTTTYNRFHTPDDDDAGIGRLRELHVALDRAVLDAYGWPDVPEAREFIEEASDDEGDEAAPTRVRVRPKKYRYRWPDEVREDVMGRLLALNAARATAEGDDRNGGGVAPPSPTRPSGRPRAPRSAPPTQGLLTL